MPVAADAQQLHVDAAGALDRGFVAAAIIVYVFQRNSAVGNVYVLRRNVHVAQEVIVHPAVVALQLIRLYPVVFVEVEGHNAGEVEPLFAVQPNQLTINAQRRRAGRQAKHRHLAE